jgi:hypothetical protein
MKTINLILIMAFSASMLIITSCSKEENEEKTPTALDYINDIIGTYDGTYMESDGLKISDSAHAVVSHMGGLSLEIHCYGELLDTTFHMNIYANHDSLMLCSTGATFANMYGHELGGSHMNHHENSSTEWMHHMEDEHDDRDIHYGGFNMSNHTMDYTFRIEESNSIKFIRFQGIR